MSTIPWRKLPEINNFLIKIIDVKCGSVNQNERGAGFTLNDFIDPESSPLFIMRFMATDFEDKSFERHHIIITDGEKYNKLATTNFVNYHIMYANYIEIPTIKDVHGAIYNYLRIINI